MGPTVQLISQSLDYLVTPQALSRHKPLRWGNFQENHLAKVSHLKVSFVIHNLPVMAHMERISAALEKERGQPWGLAQGLCPEVSGGLLIVMPREQAAAYCKDMERLEV